MRNTNIITALAAMHSQNMSWLEASRVRIPSANQAAASPKKLRLPLRASSLQLWTRSSQPGTRLRIQAIHWLM